MKIYRIYNKNYRIYIHGLTITFGIIGSMVILQSVPKFEQIVFTNTILLCI